VNRLRSPWALWLAGLLAGLALPLMPWLHVRVQLVPAAALDAVAAGQPVAGVVREDSVPLLAGSLTADGCPLALVATPGSAAGRQAGLWQRLGGAAVTGLLVLWTTFLVLERTRLPALGVREVVFVSAVLCSLTMVLVTVLAPPGACPPDSPWQGHLAHVQAANPAWPGVGLALVALALAGGAVIGAARRASDRA
jgi:hypothetical protein